MRDLDIGGGVSIVIGGGGPDRSWSVTCGQRVLDTGVRANAFSAKRAAMEAAFKILVIDQSRAARMSAYVNHGYSVPIARTLVAGQDSYLRSWSKWAPIAKLASAVRSRDPMPPLEGIRK